MTKEIDCNHRKTITFSAFWDVPTNPKESYKLGHIKCANKKELDFFVCEEEVEIQCKNKIQLKRNELPSLKYLEKLPKYCNSKDFVYTKFCQKIQSSTFLTLSQIWTSKILLFNEMKNRSNAEYIIWRDCIHESNFPEILKHEATNQITINKYGYNVPSRPFNGLLDFDENLFKTWVLAQVIKIPSGIIDEVIKVYIQCLKYADSNFKIYDEEIVLSLMCNEYPELFYIIND